MKLVHKNEGLKK